MENRDRPNLNFKNVSILLLILVFAAGIYLRIAFLKDIDYSGSVPDEKYYLKYALYAAENKAASFRKLAEEYMGNESDHIFPSPIRVGYILLASFWMKAVRIFDYTALSYMSAFFGILSLFVGYAFTRRLFDKSTALLSLILFAVSPMNLAFSRRASQESVLYFFTILTLYLFYIALKKNNIVSRVLFAALFFVTIMVKESALLLVPFFVVYLFLEKRFFSKEIQTGAILLIISITIGLVFVSYIVVTGGVEKLFNLASIIIGSPITNRWAIEHLHGPLSRYAFDFFLISPLTLVAAAGFLILYFSGKAPSTESYAYLAAFFVIYYLSYSLYIKNLRYVMALDFPIRVFAAIFVLSLLARFKLTNFAASLAVISLIGLVDFFIFYRFYVANPIFYDPITGNLIGCWENFIIWH